MIVQTDEQVVKRRESYWLWHYWLVDLSIRKVMLLPFDERLEPRAASERLSRTIHHSHAASDGRNLEFHEDGDLHVGYPTGERVALGVDSSGPFLCLPGRRILYVSRQRELWIVRTDGSGNRRVYPSDE